jgi:beta-N-acetylhexosaminidase
MVAAEAAGAPAERAKAALAAGCDMVLVCNDRGAAVAVAEALTDYSEPVGQLRLARLHRGAVVPGRTELRASGDWLSARDAVARLDIRSGVRLRPR